MYIYLYLFIVYLAFRFFVLLAASAPQQASCLVNPRAGYETTLNLKPARMDERKRVAVVGSGPAGLAAATGCAERGHKVTLFESASHVGGQVREEWKGGGGGEGGFFFGRVMTWFVVVFWLRWFCWSYFFEFLFFVFFVVVSVNWFVCSDFCFVGDTCVLRSVVWGRERAKNKK